MTKKNVGVDLDPSVYMRAPNLSVAGAIGLGSALITVLPPKANKPVRTCAGVLREKLVVLKDLWTQSPSASGPDPRPYDVALDAAWRALNLRLSGAAELPVERHPKAARAQAMLELLFPDGMSFLTLPYQEQWAESDRRLSKLTEKKTEAEVAALAGPEHLDELRGAHKAYGEVLGITKAGARPPAPPDLSVPLREALDAIAKLSLQLVAQAMDPSTEDPAPFVSALARIDAVRSAGPKSKPVPPVPAQPGPIPEIPAEQ